MDIFLEQEPEESLRAEIDFYFKSCETTKTQPTISGLTYALGLDDKNILLNYKGIHERLIKRTILRLEISIEEKIYSSSFDGASYVLACCFSQINKANGKNFLFDVDTILKASDEIERR